MTDLIPEALYTRTEIHQLLGGDLQSYLPHVNGQVVCGCFDIGANPNAPEEILVGEGKNVVKYAKNLKCQTIPVFLKQAVNEWKFMGYYRYEGYSENCEEVAAKARAAGRSDIVGILRLKPVAH